jgi:hypothetical protein
VRQDVCDPHHHHHRSKTHTQTRPLAPQVKETLACYKTSALEHPGVKMVAWERGQYYVGGEGKCCSRR